MLLLPSHSTEGARTILKLHLQGEDRQIEISRQLNVLFVTIGEHRTECRIIQQDGGCFVLEWISPNGQARHIHAAGSAAGDERQLWVDGRLFSYKRAAPRRGESEVDGSLASSIPAIVTELLVEIGTTVDPGDKLVLLESMKMVIPIQAPYAGIVTAIHCAAGDSVQAGVPLLEISKAATP